jgi:tetratricopeptide (TPR) repeat protein
VLEGSVRKEGRRVRISAQLVDVRDGMRVWTESYDRELTGVFEVQDEIARAVAAALEVRLLPGHAASPTQRRATNPEAYSQYLLGRHLFGRQAFTLAAEAYERALRLEPDYAPALAGLALALTYTDYGGAEESRTAALAMRERALAAAERAVALAPDLPDGYRARGFLRCVHRYDWAGGLADLERGVSLQPGDPEAHRLLGVLRGAHGRSREGILRVKRAIELDPLSASSWNTLGWLQIFDGQLAPARTALLRSLEIAPQQGFAEQNLGMISLVEGDPAAAEAQFARSTFPISALLGVALAQHDLGNLRRARGALETLMAGTPDRNAWAIATIHAWWGDADRAFEWLDRAYARRDLRLALLVKCYPSLVRIRGDPRYPALLRRMNLPVD